MSPIRLRVAVLVIALVIVFALLSTAQPSRAVLVRMSASTLLFVVLILASYKKVLTNRHITGNEDRDVPSKDIGNLAIMTLIFGIGANMLDGWPAAKVGLNLFVLNFIIGTISWVIVDIIRMKIMGFK